MNALCRGYLFTSWPIVRSVSSRANGRPAGGIPAVSLPLINSFPLVSAKARAPTEFKQLRLTTSLAILLTNCEQNCPLSPSRLANPRLANLLVLPTSKAANRHYVRFALFAAGISSDLLCALSPGTRLEPKARKLLL